jgi:hypothetical protein
MLYDTAKPLDRDGFLKRAVTRDVFLSDGAVVRIRALPASMIVQGVADAKEVFDPANLLVKSLCDANGALMFSEGEKNEALTVDHQSLKTILDAIVELNGLGAGDTAGADAAEKN